ncbi:MAG: tripartite tricarboxylate transporter substrate binding protein [Achromobacter veterisilvae]
MNILAKLQNVAAAALLCLSAVSNAQDVFPSRPIHLLVAFPPGGSTTVVAQLLAEKLGERIGQPVIVENRPGANGVIASQGLLRAPADGYTMLMVVSTHAINAVMRTSLPYDTQRDFRPVTTLYRLELVMVAHPSVKANDLRGFVSLAKTNPPGLNFAAGDNGGLTHLAAETFNAEAGTSLPVVPYKGSGPALTDTLGGHVQTYFSSPTAVIDYVRTGALKAYAISGGKRSSVLPGVPTFAESGMPDFEAGSWAGILVPAGTPENNVKLLSREINAVMTLPDVREKLEGLGLEPFTNAPDEFAALIANDIQRLGKVVRAAHMTPAQ